MKVRVMKRLALYLSAVFILLNSGCAFRNLDASTSACLECHSDGGAVVVVPATDHPVGMIYEPFARQASYEDIPALPLPAGRITCESCHMPYQGEGVSHGGLLKPRAELCSACHRL